jgi:hypothetical protein
VKCHVAVTGEKRNVYIELVAKTERKKQLGIPGRRCEDMLQYTLMTCCGGCRVQSCD